MTGNLYQYKTYSGVWETIRVMGVFSFHGHHPYVRGVTSTGREVRVDLGDLHFA